MIALHMIVSGKEKPESLQRCLNSINSQVDAIYITITTPTKSKKLKTAAERYGAIVDYQPTKFFHTVTKKQIDWFKKLGVEYTSKVGDKVFQFDKARNHSMEQVPEKYKWLFWIDTDDIFRQIKPKGSIRDCARMAEQNKLSSVFINYIYQAEIVDGKIKNVLIEHLRERLVRNDGTYKWVAPIHETLIEQKPTRKADFPNCDVLHLTTQKRWLKAIHRNVKALEFSIWDTKGKDPRPLYYLGKALFDKWKLSGEKEIKFLDSAQKLFMKYLTGENKSGWPEERSQCWEYLQEIYRFKKDMPNALITGHNALIDYDQSPTAYLNLGLTHLVKKEFDRALFWVKIAAGMDMPKSTLVNTPKDLQKRSLEIIYHACIGLNKLDQAWAAAQKLAELSPEDKIMQERVNMTTNLRTQRDITQVVVKLSKFLEQAGEKGKLKPLAEAIPQFIANNPFMVELQKKANPPRKWGKKEIAIYCGPCFTPWNPKIMKDPGEAFVGGSEEAVMYLSDSLKKIGWKVTVFADPAADEGDHNGVNYLPHYKWNMKDDFNIVIAWRRADFVDQPYKAKATYVWCHDIQNPLDYTKERLKKIEKVFVLSEWHRDNIKEVPDNKIMITGNGYAKS